LAFNAEGTATATIPMRRATARTIRYLINRSVLPLHYGIAVSENMDVYDVTTP
jgi:hypothetical protein